MRRNIDSIKVSTYLSIIDIKFKNFFKMIFMKSRRVQRVCFVDESASNWLHSELISNLSVDRIGVFLIQFVVQFESL